MKEPATIEEPLRIHTFPIGANRHTEALGYRGSTKTGQALFARLDWTNWRLDGPAVHMFNAGGHYLHVHTNEDTWYRVRCWYAGGTYRGKAVTGIGISCDDGKLMWIVRTGTKLTLK